MREGFERPHDMGAAVLEKISGTEDEACVWLSQAEAWAFVAVESPTSTSTGTEPTTARQQQPNALPSRSLLPTQPPQHLRADHAAFIVRASKLRITRRPAAAARCKLPAQLHAPSSACAAPPQTLPARPPIWRIPP